MCAKIMWGEWEGQLRFKKWGFNLGVYIVNATAVFSDSIFLLFSFFFFLISPFSTSTSVLTSPSPHRLILDLK